MNVGVLGSSPLVVGAGQSGQTITVQATSPRLSYGFLMGAYLDERRQAEALAQGEPFAEYLCFLRERARLTWFGVSRVLVATKIGNFTP